MASDGSITFSTALDNDQLEKDLKEAERTVARLEKKVNSSRGKRSALEEEMGRAQAAIEATSERAEGLRLRLEELRDVDPTNQAGWESARREIESVQQSLERAEQREAQLADDKYKLDQKWQRANEEVRKHEQELAGATARASELGEAYGNAVSEANSATARATEALRGTFEQVGKRINTMIRRVFVLQVALSALRGLRSSIAEALMENDRLSASVAGLRAAFQGVVNYVAGAVAPAITAMVNVAASAIVNLARLIDSLFGTSIMQAIAKARQAAEAAWRQTDASKAAAKAAEKQAKAAKKLSRATDKATKSVMGFDEINALNADDSADAADALGDEAAGVAGDGLKPDWEALDVGKIDAKLSEIMLILGAAIMAVGAILAFSGINIPLGITLMMVGALMIRAAYKENWDRLPGEVRQAITGMLVLTGVVLLAIGAVLALSGANVALGVGMMVAGALLLWTAVALNWKELPAEMQAAVSALMLALGLALLAVGAVLAFSGGNVALGIALMAVGAASLAAVAALNWKALHGDVKRAVTAIASVVGAAVLVVGAVLAFSGANLPLGVALMAAGAIALGSALVLNWKALPEEVRQVVSAIMAVVSVALLVLGAVLTFSMANPTLGLGLLMLGAAGLASVAALNWSTLPSSVKRVVTAIMVAVGAALLVLGAVIAFSGAYLPLGIALIAAGAAALAGASSLNWSLLPESVRGVVTAILAIVGGALLVIGTILLFTGAGIPIGLGCIVAGAASLAGAIAPNWGFLRDKVREIWAGIVSWWRSNVAQIFTWNWWANLFKSIVNGLIWCVNQGLGVFGSFCNSIGKAISGTLDFFGVKGYSFTVRMGQIPYLAQGAVIPPNREFMAVLGDQRRGNNIETPEALMRQVVREEAGAMVAEAIRQIGTMGAAGAQQSRGAGDLVLVVDGRELGRCTMRGIRDLDATGELGSGLSLLYT